MIQITKEKKSNLVHLKYAGVITHADYKKVLIPQLEKAIKTSGPLRLFCDMSDFKRIRGKAIWDDYKFGIHHLKDFKRIATVGDQWWMGPLMRFSSLFFREMKLKHFKSDQYEEALKWVDRK